MPVHGLVAVYNLLLAWCHTNLVQYLRQTRSMRAKRGVCASIPVSEQPEVTRRAEAHPVVDSRSGCFFVSRRSVSTSASKPITGVFCFRHAACHTVIHRLNALAGKLESFLCRLPISLHDACHPPCDIGLLPSLERQGGSSRISSQRGSITPALTARALLANACDPSASHTPEGA